MDWAELDANLLHFISKKLGDFVSFSCFRGVCKNWRLAVVSSDHPPSLPWLLQHEKKSFWTTSLEFFSLQSNKTHTLNIPVSKISDMAIITPGPSSQYVYIVDPCNSTMLFLNPLKGTYIPYNEPSQSKFIHIPIVINSDPNENRHIAIMQNCDFAIMQNPNENRHIPPEKRTMLVIFVHYDGTMLTKEVKVPCVRTIAYSKGRLFSSVDGITWVADVADVDNENEVLAFPEPGLGLHHLIEAFGDLFGVIRGLKRKYEVYRLEGDGAYPHWLKINNGIGDLMLFLDSHKRGFGLKASDYNGYRGNCIYFMRDNNRFEDRINNAHKYTLARYDLASDTTQVLPFSTNLSTSWFLPSLC